MPVSAVLSNHFKYQRDDGKITLLTDSIKVLLMRSGFIFNKDDHAKYINVVNTSGVISSLTFADGANTLTRGAGSFVTNGFVVGMQITTNSANPANVGPFLITVVNSNGLVLTVTDTAGANPSLTSGAESNVTVVGDDELATVGGYTKNDKVLTGQTLTEDDTSDVSLMLCDDISWTGTGAGFGPTSGAIFVDDTTSDKTIIGYLNFGTDQTIAAAASLVLAGVGIQSA